MHLFILELKSFDALSLSKYQKFVQKLGIACSPVVLISSAVSLPIKIRKFVFIRAPFVHKKSQESFGVSNFKKCFILKSKNLQSLVMVLNYIQNNLKLNVECKITKTTKHFNYI